MRTELLRKSTLIDTKGLKPAMLEGIDKGYYSVALAALSPEIMVACKKQVMDRYYLELDRVQKQLLYIQTISLAGDKLK